MCLIWLCCVVMNCCVVLRSWVVECVLLCVVGGVVCECVLFGGVVFFLFCLIGYL